MLILGNLDADGYLKDPPLEELAAEAGVTLELAERCSRGSRSSIRSASPRASSRSAC